MIILLPMFHTYHNAFIKLEIVNFIMEVDLKKLADFLVKAKTRTYASGQNNNVVPQRPDFNELEFKEGDWEYRDSYCGFFRAPGQEIVRFNSKPVWGMSYDGGMIKGFHNDKELAKKTFGFLQKAMSRIDNKKPFRGPEKFKEGDYEYNMQVDGDITDFKGTEKILLKNKIVFLQNFMGGLIIQ